MTVRLEQAISHLTPTQLERLTELAESWAKKNPDQSVPSGQSKTWRFDWVGALTDQPERSGVEAQRTAMAEWDDLVERGRTR